MPAKLDRAKLKDLIVYLWQLGANDENMGAVKLNKLLFFADKEAYLTLGESITGSKYQHLAEGPAPTAVPPLTNELIEQGRLRPDPRPVGDYTQKRLEVLKPNTMERFSPEELRIIQRVVLRYWYLNADELSNLSHAEWGWKVTQNGEEIPHYMAWLSTAELTIEQVAFGQQLWGQLSGETASV